MLKKEDFTTNEIKSLIRDLKKYYAEQPGGKMRVSEITCNYQGEELQFVDLVQEGGGMLGIALVGYVYVLEEMGIRFLSMGGTSAGSINTYLMAALAPPAKKKSDKILDLLVEKDFMEFVDGGLLPRLLVKGLTGRSVFFKLTGKLPWILLNLPRIWRRGGLNPGNNFQKWLADDIWHKRREKPISTQELADRMKDLPEEMMHNDRQIDAEDLNIQLAIVCADITTQTKVIFPKMADLYFEKTACANPALFVRASMSIPGFFEPLNIDLGSLVQDTNASVHWERLARFKGDIPQKVKLVDGGIMSNFPIDIFHENDKMPKRPTFGVRLGIDRKNAKTTDKFVEIIGASFDGARSIRDFEFLENNDDYKQLVTHIDVGDHNWLDFKLDDTAKIDLFKRGAYAAAAFLKGFHWEKYKQFRKRKLFFSTGQLMETLWSREDALRKSGLERFIEIGKEELKTFKNKLDVLGPKKILWVDDDHTNDYFEVHLLKSLGFQVVLAASTDEALDYITKETDEKIDLVITDSKRDGNPDAGVQLCREIRKNDDWKSLPIIMHSLTLREGNQYEKIQKVYPDVFNNIENILDPRKLILKVVGLLAEHEAKSV